MFSVRPVFIGWIALLYQLPFQLFFTVWSGAFFGGLISSLHIFPRNSWGPFAFFGGLEFFGVPLVTYFGKKLNYSRTEYKFLNDQLEFEEGFFNINEKVIKFKDIREVTLRKGFFQRMYDLGTIYLATEATGSAPLLMFLTHSDLETYPQAASAFAMSVIPTKRSRESEASSIHGTSNAFWLCARPPLAIDRMNWPIVAVGLGSR